MSRLTPSATHKMARNHGRSTRKAVVVTSIFLHINYLLCFVNWSVTFRSALVTELLSAEPQLRPVGLPTAAIICFRVVPIDYRLGHCTGGDDQ